MTSAAHSPITHLEVHGDVPEGLSGSLIAVGASAAHAVDLGAGQAASYRSRSLPVDRGRHPRLATELVVFGQSILVFERGSRAFELSPDLEQLRQVDVAGQGRGLAAVAMRSAFTDDLHVVTAARYGTQSHVVVSADAFTRTDRPIFGGTGRVKAIAITQNCVVFAADGSVGLIARDGGDRITWIATNAEAPRLARADDVDGVTTLVTFTPARERWTLDATLSTFTREVLETPTHVDANMRRTDPEHLVFVADDSRRHQPNGGWLVGFAHPLSADGAEVVVYDAADITRGAIATVDIPRPIPRRLNAAWFTTSINTNNSKGH